jgi:citrate synthase
MSSAKLILNGNEHELSVISGSEGEVAVDVRALRKASGAITYDPGYGNTGSCSSSITFIDGEKGILRYRGYPIEELARHTSFTEICHLLIHGDLPTKKEFSDFSRELTYHSLLHEDMKKFFEGYPPSAHPMSVLSAMVASLSTYYPENGDPEETRLNVVRLLAKLKTIAAFSHKKSIGQPFVYPRNDLSCSIRGIRGARSLCPRD